jgi:ergothioneine biosynthesis protein EgtB
VAEIGTYRDHVDAGMMRLIEEADGETWSRVAPLLELGLHHEQQHQELLLTDIKHVFSCNPLHPAYGSRRAHGPGAVPAMGWVSLDGGVFEIGHQGPGFAFDNEGPRHEVLVQPFGIASRLVTNGEYLAFIEDSGYERPELWLSDGWHSVRTKGWTAPLYWERVEGEWQIMTLSGMRPPEADEPVCHVSYFEADAYAAWAGKRLPTEAEWEVACVSAGGHEEGGNLLASGQLHPVPCAGGGAGTRPAQMFGDVWEWTRSAYSPYPGFRPDPGAVGEYNSKFMCNQFVLRGGSCVTPPGHIRATYRNFFPPAARWQFTGIRLAEEA